MPLVVAGGWVLLVISPTPVLGKEVRPASWFLGGVPGGRVWNTKYLALLCHVPRAHLGMPGPTVVYLQHELVGCCGGWQCRGAGVPTMRTLCPPPLGAAGREDEPGGCLLPRKLASGSAVLERRVRSHSHFWSPLSSLKRAALF